MQGWGRYETVRETDRQMGREGETRRQEDKCIWRKQRWKGGRVGGWGWGIVTDGMQKKEGHTYIVTGIQV